MACGCIDIVNEGLALRNTQVAVPMVFGSDRTARAMIETEQVKTGRGQQKAAALFAAFCPFCGAKYEGES